MAKGREKTLPKGKCIDGKRKEEMFTDRSGWWRNTIKNYPIPGSYHIRDFIEETGLNPVPRTYSFKGPGRNTLMPTVRRGGDLLLPGAYNFTDSTNEALRRQATYSFKNCPRPDNLTLGLRDKDINLSPGHYDVTEKPVPKSPCNYHIRDFIEETGLNPVPRTYSFKGPGRNTLMPTVRRGGDLLLPGAYNFTDSTNEALRRQATYSFKNCPRPDNLTLGLRDKDINLSPGHYDVTEKPVPKSPCKHVMFRSAVQRVSFLPGTPGPGVHEPTWHKGQRLSTEGKVDWDYDLLFRNTP